MLEDLLPNGLDATTGEYLLAGTSVESLAHEILADAHGGRDAEQTEQLKRAEWLAKRPHLGPKEGVDPKDLAQTGWGVIFAGEPDPAVVEALTPLLAHRRRQAAARNERFYREFRGSDSPQPGESKQRFLARHGAGFGPADPDNVPYYLLLVGDPETIPWSFQYQLDVEYGVGRIWFETPAEYAAYAENVVALETNAIPRSRRAVFFGPRNPGDKATALMADHLIGPLARSLARDQPSFAIETAVAEAASKQRLGELLGEPPALLFSACHGMGFPSGDPRQLPCQGALLCQDWPGPGSEAITEECYFAAGDLASSVRLEGLLAFHFGCHGAGTPRIDGFAHRLGAARELAPHAFLARLPQRLLAQGALAMVAHVDRGWGWSFLWPRVGEQLQVFESTLKRLCEGHPVGSAMEYFNRRYAELATALAAELEEIDDGRRIDEAELARLWTCHNDARSYVVVGDPAVRLTVGAPTS